MNHAEVLEQAVLLAVKNGWRGELQEDPWRIHTIDNGCLVFCRRQADGLNRHDDVAAIIFDHDFAKALWGNDPASPSWQMHLQRMVIAEDRITYIAEHLSA